MSIKAAVFEGVNNLMHGKAMSSDHHFQVDLRGVIDLLSDHLYSGPQVYIRELLQNAVDAIFARQHSEPGHQGGIKLEIVRSGNNPPTLAVHDDGIGLTESEVHQFLATIGQSSKRESLARDDFIGQFGIGLLSGFVVCEEIVVITRSIQADAKTIEWKGRSDGTYSLRQLDLDSEPGTQVYLRAKPGCHEFFETHFVRDTARYYGSHLPVSIQVWADDDHTLINETPPWRYEFTSTQIQNERFLAYGTAIFESDFLDAIPLSSEVGGVEGVAYILPNSSAVATKRTHRVYLKNMLLSESVDNLLPDWAFFVKCVVNATDLRPTASREGFYEDENLAAARDELGGCLRRYLFQLAQQDRQRLDRIIQLHQLPIKGLATEDDEFYKMFIDWLPFETSLGEMTLGEYRERHSVVRYVPSRDQFRQISGVAAAQQMCVINTCYTYDTELIEKLEHVFSGQRVECVDISELAQDFEDLTLDEREEIFELVKLADLVLQPFKCSADIKKFQPDTLPTLFTANDAATFLRSVDQAKEVADDLWSGVLERIATDPAASANAQLCLNYENKLVRKMAMLADRELLRRALEMLYVQALLLGHYPLKEPEMALLNDGLLGLIEYSVARGDDS